MQSILQNLRELPTWALVVAGVLLLVVVVAIVVLIVKRRGASKAPSGPAPAPLTDVWKRFLRGLPREAQFLPVTIVIGASRAGKSQLIQSHQDWEGLDRQLFPSVTDDPRMQLYVGRSALVQEIAWALLADRDAATEQQLDDLWRPLFTERAPVVVLVVDAAHLRSPDELGELADFARGKLNILTRIRGEPPAIRLCLSHVDELSGYRPVTAAMGERRREVALALSGPADDQQIARALAPLEPWTAQILVGGSAADFKRSNALFARDIPAISRGIAPLLRGLATSSYLSRPPAIDDLALSGLEPGDCIGDSLAVDTSESDEAAKRWTQRHMQIAGALAGGAIVAAAALLGWHGSTVSRAEDAATALARAAEDARPLGRERVASRAVLDREREAVDRLHAVSRQESWAFFRGTWADEKRSARDRTLATLRDFYIAARLDPDESNEVLLRAVALTRASVDGGLGAMIRDDAAKWADVLRLPEPVVRDYVALSPKTWEGKIVVPTPAPSRQQPAARDLGVWRAYLDSLAAIYGRGAVTSTELAALRTETLSLLTVVDEAARWDEMRIIANRLLQEAPYDRDSVEPLLAGGDVYDWVSKNRVALQGLLGMVKETSIDAASMSSTNLSGLLAALAAAPTLALGDKTYELTLEQRKYAFKSKDWGDVVTKSRSSLLVDTFMRTPRDGSYAFFTSPRAYPDTGRAAVPGKGPSGAVPGVYTRDAFDREVSPSLVTFADQIGKLPLSDADRTKLTTYVSAEVERYASSYRSALSTYYASFQLQAGSAATARAIIGEIALPTSFLSDFLATVARNAALEIKDGDAFKTISKQLESFQPIVAVMTESKGQYPNLAKYTALVAPFADAPAGAGAGAGAPLVDRLTPMGRAALSILRSDKDAIAPAVDAWIAASGVGGSLSAPFTLPVRVGYAYGIAEVEQAVSAAWQVEILPDVSPLVSKFPFNQKSDEDANPVDVTSVFVPTKGKFWINADLTLIQVCTQRSGRWAAISGSYGRARLPKGALSTLNGASQMSVLWDKDGKPQPLNVTIQPQALPADGPQQDLVPTLAVLRTGGSQVLAFNQKATWQTVELAWDNEGSSSLELQLGSPDSTKKQVSTVDGGDGTWSFYRLRAKATVSANGVTTWSVPVSGSTSTVAVKFAIRGASWAPFQISTTGS